MSLQCCARCRDHFSIARATAADSAVRRLCNAAPGTYAFSMYSCSIRTLLNRGASAAMLARIRAIHRRGRPSASRS
jgi:hypothetical protein